MPNRTPQISITQIMYVILLVALFAIGYLLAKVQTLEKVNGTGTVNQPSQAQAPLAPNQPPQPLGKVDVSEGHLSILGDKNAKVTLVEFSDFQCPFCRKFFQESFGQIKKDYVDTGKVKLAFRHFPLDFHAMAVPTALASECANEQNKFWQYHDKVFEEQAKQGDGTITYSKDDLKKWAVEIGLNSNNFNQCLDSEKYKTQVEQDAQDGRNAQVNGTPTVYVNGNQIVGAQPYSSFKEAIEKELKQ